MDAIKHVRLYPPETDGSCRTIVIYEVPDVKELPDDGRYLSIDLGLHNLMTCYSSDGRCFIVGRKYLSLCQRYDKKIR